MYIMDFVKTLSHVLWEAWCHNCIIHVTACYRIVPPFAASMREVGSDGTNVRGYGSAYCLLVLGTDGTSACR